jgi:FkbM family methyltransferase
MDKAKLIEFLGRVPVVSHVLRWWASRYPEGSVVAVRSGLAEGLLWRRSHRYVNGYWTGQYELDVQHAIARHLGPGGVFFDIGANAGFFSLVATRQVGPTGACISVDPDPFNAAQIRELARLNATDHWTVHQKAVAEQRGMLRFVTAAPGDSTGHLIDAGSQAATGGRANDHGGIDVEVTTLGDLYAAHGRPTLVKLDVEGAEVRALEGAPRMIREARPHWLIELHADELAVRTREILGTAGYRFTTIAGEPIPDSRPLDHHVLAVPA